MMHAAQAEIVTDLLQASVLTEYTRYDLLSHAHPKHHGDPAEAKQEEANDPNKPFLMKRTSMGAFVPSRMTPLPEIEIRITHS